jgi:hypothetical protein
MCLSRYLASDLKASLFLSPPLQCSSRLNVPDAIMNTYVPFASPADQRQYLLKVICLRPRANMRVFNARDKWGGVVVNEVSGMEGKKERQVRLEEDEAGRRCFSCTEGLAPRRRAGRQGNDEGEDRLRLFSRAFGRCMAQNMIQKSTKMRVVHLQPVLTNMLT